MNVYLFQAALLCEPCGIAASAVNMPDGDSDRFPQGPYADGGGEADTPQHCDHCGLFLENPLTQDGAAYVMEHGKLERRALRRVYLRDAKLVPASYLAFRRTCWYSNGMGCWILPWCNMMLGIEKDGYTHS